MPTNDIQLIKALLEANGGFVSGSRIAQVLGVSRVSVWSRLEKLKTEGFDFEAVRNRGYRLVTAPRVVHPLLLGALCARQGINLNLFYNKEIDSTNDEAQRLLASGEETPLVVLASRQSRGRGRRGRSWFSVDHGNLYLSFAFHPQLPPARMQRFTLWMGVRLCRMLSEKYGLPLYVKWPNDIVFREKNQLRKLAGMLTEARIDADEMRDLVFGLGLNLSTPIEAWPEDLYKTAASLYMLTGQPIDINDAAAEVIVTGLAAYEEFLNGDITQTLEAQWPQVDALRGLTVTARKGNERIKGRASGIAPDGSLILKPEEGPEVTVSAGEVTIQKHFTAAN